MIERILTSYTGNTNANFSDRLSNFVLTPFDIALGRKVKITPIEISEESQFFTEAIRHMRFSEEKSPSLAKRISAGILATLLFPLTLAACIQRVTSRTQKQLVHEEQQALDALRKIRYQESPLGMSFLQQEQTNLTIEKQRREKGHK